MHSAGEGRVRPEHGKGWSGASMDRGDSEEDLKEYRL